MHLYYEPFGQEMIQWIHREPPRPLQTLLVLPDPFLTQVDYFLNEILWTPRGEGEFIPWSAIAFEVRASHGMRDAWMAALGSLTRPTTPTTPRAHPKRTHVQRITRRA